jgi:prepilin-type N-terminal cleavage/methylation domain-containing protein
MAQTERRRTAAFTLIEMLAVVAIVALISSFVLPNIGALQDRTLRSQARLMAAQLELARQRAVITGIPHRLLIDLDGGGYRLEWLRAEPGTEPAAAPPEGPPEYDVRGGTPLPLAAPAEARREYQPVPGSFGKFLYLESNLEFAGLQTPEGWIKRGDAFVGFDRDGTASYTEIVIQDASGRRITLDVLPLDDAVRLRNDEN